MKPYKIINAFEQGLEIEARNKGDARQYGWFKVNRFLFDFENFDYRIKKEPVKFNCLVGKIVSSKINPNNIDMVISENSSLGILIGGKDWMSKEHFKKNYKIED